MALVEMVMPKMGESITEGTILNWLKNVGDRIEQDESVLEVATDKVDTEVPATHAGVLREILAQKGDVVPVGQVIARIATGQEATTDLPAADPVLHPAEAAEAAAALEAGIEALTSRGAATSSPLLDSPVAGRFYSPLVMSMAKQENIAPAELERIPGSGADGRVTKKDVLHYLQHRPVSTPASQPPATSQPVVSPSPLPPVAAPVATPPLADQPVIIEKAASVNGRADIIEMDRMRKMIAQRMVDSKRISPHVTSFVEADLTHLVQWRNRVKEQFKRQEGENITFTPLFIEALAKALRDFPMVNISVDGDRILVKKDINIGMAVALPSGNLIVPVIKNADQYNLVGLTKRVNALAARARDNKLTADDLADGTYTMSNVGSFGSVMGTPILVQPQAGIMAFGTVQKKPAVLETPTGDVIAVRHLMFLSHSYDHRVVDGALGGLFARKVADYLEAFDLNRPLA